MKKLLTLVVAIAALFSFGSLNAKAQGSSDYSGGLKVKLNEDGSKYVRFITWHQFQGIYTEGEGDKDATFDTKLRRSRFLAYAQLNKKFMILTHFGINNQTASSGGLGDSKTTGKKPQLYMHDAWVQYNVFNKTDFTLDFGAGLHYWNGISRLSMGSTLNFLQVDAPIFNWPTIEKTDQFARQMGYYIKGYAGNFQYSFAATEPFKPTAPITLEKGGAAVFNETDKWAFNGYVAYQFAEKESSSLPYRVGTYVGTKSIFNIGAGFYVHPDASIRAEADSALTKENHMFFSVDAFYDQPIGGEMALTAYGVYYNYDFGKNYTRGTLVGTGSIIFVQAGLLLPKDILGDELGHLQPFAGFSFKDFEGHDDSLTQLDLGVNWFLEGHHSRITLQYSSVPYINNNNDVEHKSQVILQTQVYL